jgi:hypothetical protein
MTQPGSDPRHRRHHRLYLVLKILLAVMLALFAFSQLFAVTKELVNRNIWFNDFFGIWAFAKFTAAHHAVNIYDDPDMMYFQMDLGEDPVGWFRYVYPPSFLLLIYPLKFLSYYLAYLAWVSLSFAAYIAASLYRTGRLHRYRAFLTILAPATIVGITTGQTGLLVSALIVGGFRLIGNRPILSGIAFGLASVKPQFGLLIPIALISSGQWRSLVCAGVTVSALVLASSLAFGWSLWPTWLSKLPAHSAWAADVQDRLQPTILANLTSIGVNRAVAWTFQAGGAALAAISIWVCFRRGITTRAVAALYPGAFLATPYAFTYDMPMLTNAALAVPPQRCQPTGVLRITEIAARLLVLMLPIIVLSYKMSMIRCFPIVILFCFNVWRAVDVRSDNRVVG